jgi:hypothetical protein
MENFRVKIAGSEEIVLILLEPKAIRKELQKLRWKKIMQIVAVRTPPSPSSFGLTPIGGRSLNPGGRLMSITIAARTEDLFNVRGIR